MNIAATHRPEIRIVLTLPIAFMATCLLLFFMHRLIYVETPAINEVITPTIAGILYVPPIIETRLDQPKPTKASEPMVTPEIPKLTKTVTDDKIVAITQNYGYEAPVNESAISFSTDDNVVQQVMVPPQYPNTALNKGIEGYVDITFDVSPAGVTQNIRVMRASPEGVFEKAAIKAVQRWKYLPRDSADAKPVTMQERIRFSTEKL